MFRKPGITALVVLVSLLVIGGLAYALMKSDVATNLGGESLMPPVASSTPNPTPTSSTPAPELSDAFSQTSTKYTNDQLGFSLSYPSDISIVVATGTTLPPNSSRYSATRLTFTYQGASLTSMTFGGAPISATSSWWRYDSTKGSYVFEPYWAKTNIPCPTYFFDNKTLPTAVTSFGDGGDWSDAYHILLNGRVLTVEIGDYDFEFAYRYKPAEERARAWREKQIGDKLRQKILESLTLTRDTARSFTCIPRSN